jgi:hypothetical protein
MSKCSTRRSRFILTALVTVLIPIFCIQAEVVASEKNRITFINESGEDALVKLVGPSHRVVQVSNGQSATVNIAGGTYAVYVRYGKGPGYGYARGEAFEIEDSTHSYTKASLTLHGVINGNYHVEGSSAEEFNKQ